LTRPLRRCAALLFGLGLLGCAPAGPTVVAPSGPVVSVSNPPPSSPSPSLAPPTAATSASPSARPSPATSPSVAWDETLLSILPAEVAGVPLKPEPDAFATATADPAFGEDVASAAFATAFDSGDLASGIVAKLRPGRYSTTMFRAWRDTYDAGACGQAGGVGGHAQATLGGRTIDITTCNGGLRVYHAWLPERGVIVSLFSLGDRRFGEQVMAGLRP
jgi:hypothetical protein